MKKIISIFCTFTVSSIPSISIISCATNNKTVNRETNKGKLDQYIDEMEENLIFDQLERKGIDGSNLSINNTLQDALDLIYEKILLDEPEVENVSLKKGKLDDFLVEGTNIIDFEYQVHKQKKIISVHINNVKALDNRNININEHDSEELIRDKFFKGITPDNLYGWNTIFDALSYFQNEAKKINPKAHVKFSDKYVISKIGKKNFEIFEKGQINVPTDQNNKTFSEILTYSQTKRPIPITQIISVATAIGVLAYGAGVSVVGAVASLAAGTYGITAYLMQLFGNLKRSQEYFLTKESEQFDLEVYFDDNSKIDIKNESFNNKKFEVIGILKGIKLRSREAAREIIERETYTFKHQLTIEEALIGVEQHIRTTMFPTTMNSTSNHNFTLRTVLKNPSVASEKIHIGLNEIQTVLKPQLAGGFINIFKRIFNRGDIDVTIRIKYQPS